MYPKGGTLFIKDFENFDVTTLTEDNPESPKVILSDDLAECLFVNPNDSITIKPYKQIAVLCRCDEDKIVLYPKVRSIPDTSDVLTYSLEGLDGEYSLQLEPKYYTEHNMMYIVKV